MENKIELLKCSDRILDKYRRYIRNNQGDSDILIQKKLYRNFLLGEELWREDNIVCRNYGRLEIIADIEGMRIINIHNKVKSKKFRYIDFLYKPQLEKLLEIEVSR
jgi:hypothetical protein